MKLTLEPYLAQANRLPSNGRYILAQYDNNSIVVYQAYRPQIGRLAAECGYFSGEFQFDRMSWIKPNFLWMMYRSGWGRKEGQETVLAITLQRTAFDKILAAAVHSKYERALYESQAEWKKAVRNSKVQLQWDPDRHPTGAKLERRAIQLGLRGEFLRKYATDWLLDIEDISDFVAQQLEFVKREDWANLLLPRETIYPVGDREVRAKLGLSEL